MIKKQVIIVFSSLSIGWLLLMLAIFSFILSGCGKDVIAGSGYVITQQREVAAFADVTVDGPFEVHLQQGVAKPVEITAEESLMRAIETYVSGTTLQVRIKNGVRLHHFKEIHVYLQNDVYHSLTFSGSGNIENTDTLRTDWFNYRIDGSGNARFTVITNKLETEVNGSGSINLNGNTKDYRSVVNGSGDIKGLDLTCTDADITVHGSGGHTLSVASNLGVRIQGSGSVHYKGNPAIKSEIHGSGSVIKL